ncbi:Per1-like family protein [Actinidia rufa]|uniref:Post-GPI attachment to proteins factor 3 n=1 Tax=Actinidia rufa TaxID=165716 RepID=A0A7J0GWW1_9ERIC|nr:Per1-like family protein [Actinidia rufa]
MEFPLMVHGISKSHFISVGNNGTATMTVNTTVCLLGRKKERNLVTNLSSIMGNGHSGVFMESRNLFLWLSLLSIWLCSFMAGYHFSSLLIYNLPLRPNKRTYYEFTGLLHLYGLLAMNSWFWSTVFHSRDVELTEKLDYSSAVALLGFSLIVTILRAFSLNKKVCVGMGVAQLLTWASWAYVTRHPSRWKLWAVVIGDGLAMLLEIYDFSPYWKLIDAHSLWHAIAIPITFLWWSFIRDDAEFRTSTLLKKTK